MVHVKNCNIMSKSVKVMSRILQIFSGSTRCIILQLIDVAITRCTYFSAMVDGCGCGLMKRLMSVQQSAAAAQRRTRSTLRSARRQRRTFTTGKFQLMRPPSALRRSDWASAQTLTTCSTTSSGGRRPSGSGNGSTTRELQVFGWANEHPVSVSAEQEVSRMIP